MIGYYTVGSKAVGDSSDANPPTQTPAQTTVVETAGSSVGNCTANAGVVAVIFTNPNASGSCIVFANSGLASSGILVNAKIDVALIDNTPTITLQPSPDISLVGI